MKAQDLDVQQRRLLKHMSRIDPQETTVQPGERAAARALSKLGLCVITEEPFLDERPAKARITEAGRRAL